MILVLHNEPKVEIIPSQMANWVVQLAIGLEFIHVNDFVHRDLKPSK